MDTSFSIKNTSKKTISTLYNSNVLLLLSAEHREDEDFQYKSILKRGMVHFYFCIEGKGVLKSGPFYTKEIKCGYSYFLYNPEKDIPCNLIITPDSRMVLLTVSLEHLHGFFINEKPSFLNPKNMNQKLYDERDTPDLLTVALNQLFHIHLDEGARKLYCQGKIMEILSLYFSVKKEDAETCPFLNDREILGKVKQAKDYLLKNSEHPPHLKELAKAVGLNEYQLKVSFKQIYGNTVFGFLLNHKMDQARLFLDSKKYKVNEVAYRIGYTNPSHFIATFKKRFGITPKKYLKSQMV